MSATIRQEFHPNGNKKFEGFYLNEKEEGKHTRWHLDGQILSTENYSRGFKTGLQEGWYSDGQQWFIFRYAEDENERAWMDATGKIVTSLHGLQEGWYQNGQKAHNDNFSSGKKDGLQEGWFPNGKQAYIENYKDGVKSGRCQSWDDKGNVIEDKTY